MGYENFKIQDITTMKIMQNAKKFDIDILTNQLLLKQIVKKPSIIIDNKELENIKNIFSTLINIEDDLQLSKI